MLLRQINGLPYSLNGFGSVFTAFWKIERWRIIDIAYVYYVLHTIVSLCY